MTAFYWFDHKSTIQNGQRVPALDGLGTLVNLLCATRIVNPDEFKLKTNCLAIVHPDNENKWKEAASLTERRYVLFVSSEPYTNQHPEEEIATYYITQPLNQIAKYIYSNSDKLRSFVQSCEEGRPDWKILQPVKWPENLVSAYLLLIAKKNKNDISSMNINSDLWVKAVKEYHLLKEAVVISEELSFDNDDVAIKNISALFHKMAVRL